MSTAEAQAPAPAAPVAEFVAFCAGGQSFSLDIAQVREIRRWIPVTALPQGAPGVLGVMNLRGAVIPIYDFAQRVGLGPTPDSPRNVVVIATNGAQTVGLLVESVSEILSVARTDIQDAPEIRPETHSGALRPCVSGLVAVEEGLTRVVDLAAVVARHEGPREGRAA